MPAALRTQPIDSSRLGLASKAPCPISLVSWSLPQPCPSVTNPFRWAIIGCGPRVREMKGMLWLVRTLSARSSILSIASWAPLRDKGNRRPHARGKGNASKNRKQRCEAPRFSCCLFLLFFCFAQIQESPKVSKTKTTK